MPLEGKEARDFFNAIKQREEEKAAAQFAEAKARAAASGKEPFDYEKLQRIATTIYEMTSNMTDAERGEYFERMYYVRYPSVVTLDKFADIVNELSRWM